MNLNPSEEQKAAIAKLEKRKFHFQRWDSEGRAMLMLKRRPSTYYVEVDHNGLCNDQPFEDYIEILG